MKQLSMILNRHILSIAIQLLDSHSAEGWVGGSFSGGTEPTAGKVAVSWVGVVLAPGEQVGKRTMGGPRPVPFLGSMTTAFSEGEAADTGDLPELLP